MTDQLEQSLDGSVLEASKLQKPEAAELSQEAKIIYDQLTQMFQELGYAEVPPLIARLPSAIFEQLVPLSSQSEVRASGESDSHWGDEMRMMRVVGERRTAIDEWLGENYSIRLQLYISLSDIGKVGWTQYEAGAPSSVVARIYNDAIFSNVHSEWIQTYLPSLTENGELTQTPHQFPPEIQALISDLAKDSAKYSAIVGFGLFHQLPIRLALYIFNQVSGESNGIEISAAEEKLLLEKGFDFSITSMGEFWTQSHLQFGNEYLMQSAMTSDQKLLGLVALTHHFSQRPPFMRQEMSDLVATILTQDKSIMVTAFLEILDKVDAIYYRGNKASVAEAMTTIREAIHRYLASNYPEDYQRLGDIYDSVFASMEDIGVFEALTRPDRENPEQQ